VTLNSSTLRKSPEIFPVGRCIGDGNPANPLYLPHFISFPRIYYFILSISKSSLNMATAATEVSTKAQTDDRIVILTSSDEKTIEAPYTVVRMSVTIKNMLEGNYNAIEPSL
jgi:hypothetical protein